MMVWVRVGGVGRRGGPFLHNSSTGTPGGADIRRATVLANRVSRLHVKSTDAVREAPACARARQRATRCTVGYTQWRDLCGVSAVLLGQTATHRCSSVCFIDARVSLTAGTRRWPTRRTTPIKFYSTLIDGGTRRSKCEAAPRSGGFGTKVMRGIAR